ncbi:MAG: choice-of-anchor R domain-containing protein [Acidimicrobiales bacterium]
MRNPKRLRAVILLVGVAVAASVLALGSLSGPARAAQSPSRVATVYDNYFTNNGVNWYNYYITGGSQTVGSVGGNASVALSFVTPPGSSIKVTKYLAPLSGRFGAANDTAVFLLVPDQGGQPNASQVLDQISIPRITTDWNGQNYSFRSVDRPVLSPSTTYWLVLSTPTPGADLNWFDTAGPSGEIQSRLMAYGDSSGNWQLAYYNTTAVRILGKVK